MALHAELHRHLGGAVVPRILWRFLVRTGHPLASEFPTYERLEAFVTHPRSSLEEYLELHSFVESVQTMDTLEYFVSKLVRGAYVFESICYLELRHTPFYRTDPALPVPMRVALMAEVVDRIDRASRQPDYPLIMRQILCMHSRLPYEVNRAIVELAASRKDAVCGLDLAGPDVFYSGRINEFVELFQMAKALGLRTTAHVFETPKGCFPELLPYLDRIGHGIQIPLHYPELLKDVAARHQCLEICPTTYLKTGTLTHIGELRPVFERCAEAGVDVVICTDNAGLHNVRLPAEIENLLTEDVIDFAQLRACEQAAFQHAFAWPLPHPPQRVLADLGGGASAKS